MVVVSCGVGDAWSRMGRGVRLPKWDVDLARVRGTVTTTTTGENIKKRKVKYLSIVIILAIGGCNLPREKVKSPLPIAYKYFDKNGKLLSKGFINTDSIQTDFWEYYSDTSISAQGHFINGSLYGRWSYDYKDFKGIIDWDTITVLESLRINYPNNFSYNLKANECILLSSDKMFEIEIKKIPFARDIVRIKKDAEDSIKGDSSTIINMRCNQIIYNNFNSYFLMFDISKKEKQGMDYRLIINSQKETFSIRMFSKELDIHKYQYFMTVYLCITNNLFIGNYKLLNPNHISSSEC